MTCGSSAFEPDWLARDLAEATADVALTWDPAAVSHLGEPPLSDADAARLRAKMAARYRARTGRELVADLASEVRS